MSTDDLKKRAYAHRGKPSSSPSPQPSPPPPASVPVPEWKERGYASFLQWWRDQKTEMLPGERSQVAYWLYDEGVSPEEAVELVPGLTEREARNLKREHELDIPIGRVGGNGPHERPYRKY